MSESLTSRLRNVAIIAHVDHGKTTLVDAMLTQTNVVRMGEDTPECVLDSNPLERERGITILSKNCAISYEFKRGKHAGETYRINIIDTPGHADFGGEVERVLRMADGALLLVDAFEGPMPQTRFVLSKALELGLRIILVVNKCDRPDARPHAVVNEVFDLLVDLHADDRSLDFTTIFAAGRQGWACRDPEQPTQDVEDLFDAIVDQVPAPTDDVNAPLQMLVTTLAYSDYVGRIAIGRVCAGKLRTGQPIAVCKGKGVIENARALRVLRFEGLGRVPTDVVQAGDLCAVEGIDGIDIGDTIADPEKPIAMPRLKVDEPTLHMIFCANNSPFAGREGKFVTSRQLAERLQRELEINVALRVEPGPTTDQFRVSGRGLLHLGILIENMRREGFELGVGRPEVIEKTIDGVRCEPVERLTIDAATEAMGPVMELLGGRNGEVKHVDTFGGRVRITSEIPARGLIGFRTRLLNAAGGEVIMHHTFDRYEAVKPYRRKRINGVMIAIETGQVTSYSCQNLADRGVLFVRPGDPVYEGQIVGEYNRDNDLGVNIVKAKAFSNMREANKEATVTLKAARDMPLEVALEYIEHDELVEVTPKAVRIRKTLLKENDRKRLLRSERSREMAAS